VAVLALLALATLVPPAAASARLVRRYLRAPAVDRAADWIEGHVNAPALVAVSLDRLALDPARFEVRTLRSFRELTPEVTGHFDLVVATRREAEGWAAFTTLASFESEEPDAGLGLLALRPLESASGRVVPPGRLRASHDTAAVPAAWDRDPGSVWQAPEGPGWIETIWPKPIEVDRVEVEAGPDPAAWPQDLALLGTADGEGWRPIAAFGLRPNRPAKQRTGAPHGQVYVLTPSLPLRGVRIERGAGGPWSLATVRVVATASPSGPAAP
jgi:hypothetical protein